jgi:hypothetical protein
MCLQQKLNQQLTNHIKTTLPTLKRTLEKQVQDLERAAKEAMQKEVTLPTLSPLFQVPLSRSLQHFFILLSRGIHQLTPIRHLHTHPRSTTVVTLMNR